MPPSEFETGRAYKYAYYIFLDASGYSTIVAFNPQDRAGEAFNLFRERAISRVRRVAVSHRCQRSELWQWRGDGGFFVIHDDDESVARDVAMEAAETFLRLDLPYLRDEFRQMGISGDLHMRMAIHRGVFHYLGDHHERSVHSADVNFGAHLEEAAPRDCLVVSADAFQVAGPHAESLTLVGLHEGRKVYVRAPSGPPAAARRAWRALHGPPGWQAVHAFPERPSQEIKAGLVDSASQRILDVGTALNTCSRYLTTTERPDWYRAAVLDFLHRGGGYDCVLLNPKSRAAEELTAQWEEDIPMKISRALDRFAEFKSRYGAAASGFRVHQTDSFGGLHALALDPETDEGMIMYSPYVGLTLPAAGRTARADTPHYLVSDAASVLYGKVRDLVMACAAPSTIQRLL
ncbi:hypothetical protein [Parafrankia sp. FMc2]|uniref:hypothetical protein n=1 Tax=Parafrankia sp. FMc2 TaxID=3233196 RepID=UPI0034D3CDCA